MQLNWSNQSQSFRVNSVQISKITRAMSAELESLQQENESLKTQIATISGESSKLSAENLEMSQRIEVMNVRGSRTLSSLNISL